MLSVHVVNGFGDLKQGETNDLNVGKEVAALQRMTIKELRTKYAEVFGEATKARHKAWLVKRIAWRLQALAEGDLSERARSGPPNWPTTPTCASRRPRSRPRPRAKGLHETATLRARPTTACRCRARSSPANTRARRSQVRSWQRLRVRRARSTSRCRPSPRRSPATTATVSSSSASARKAVRNEQDTRTRQQRRPTCDALRHLHPQVHRGGARARVQLARRPARVRARPTSAASRTRAGVCLPDRYDDGGFTGGNMDRPALQRLLADIEAGKIDCVVVYKVDRLSRSLLDFARMMEIFEKHHVAFVSVTQQFNTATSMGRLMLNVLLSFAQFEREIIAERTRDKIAAARRKGKWSGGMPAARLRRRPAGIEADRQRGRGGAGAGHLRAVPEHQALLAGRAGTGPPRLGQQALDDPQGPASAAGKPFTKTSLHQLLTNVTYVGKIRYKDEVHDGEHPAIVEPRDLAAGRKRCYNATAAPAAPPVRNKFGALLKGLLRCVPCDCAMTPTHSTRNGNKRYRYYVCTPPRNAAGTPARPIHPGGRDRTIRCRPDQVHWQGPFAIERDDRPGQKSGPVACRGTGGRTTLSGARAWEMER